jgi:hypothetical protein
MSSSSINAPNLDTSSAPMDHAYGSGGGSIIASMMARGIAVSRYTLHGTIRPFGQDTGTADDTMIRTVSGQTMCE